MSNTLDETGKKILEELELFWEGKRSRTAMIEFTKQLMYKAQFRELTKIGVLYNGSRKAWCDHYEERHKYLSEQLKEKL